ncbi:hypothetical protein PMI03_04454 [Rhizobium sp. AP16]|nr:hypothetical protein PMI03_04454 [Rhizobium sp. AP16]
MQPLTKPDAIRLQFEAGIVRSRDDLFVACSNEEERFDGFARLCGYRAGESQRRQGDKVAFNGAPQPNRLGQSSCRSCNAPEFDRSAR